MWCLGFGTLYYTVLGWLLIGLVVLLGVLMAARARREEKKGKPPPVGIGGWLLLPAIGFVLGPIMGIVSLVLSLGAYSLLEAPALEAPVALRVLRVLDLLVSLALLVFLVYAATQFFGKKKEAPAVIIAYLIASVAVSLLLLVAWLAAGAGEIAADYGARLGASVILAAVWIPYFRVSRRVKATFVN